MTARYQEWLNHVFNANSCEFDASETEVSQLIEETFRFSGRDLARFSDERVGKGIWSISSPAGSDYAFALRSDAVPLEVRLSAIASIKILYRDCFAKRCTRTLSHLDEQPSSPINSICYMFWDVSPVSYLEGHADETVLADACFSVLADTLAIDHMACQEAAIHGYGEFYFQYPDRVENAMNQFLKTRIPDSRLRTYAENAKTGCIP